MGFAYHINGFQPQLSHLLLPLQSGSIIIICYPNLNAVLTAAPLAAAPMKTSLITALGRGLVMGASKEIKNATSSVLAKPWYFICDGTTTHPWKRDRGSSSMNNTKRELFPCAALTTCVGVPGTSTTCWHVFYSLDARNRKLNTVQLIICRQQIIPTVVPRPPVKYPLSIWISWNADVFRNIRNTKFKWGLLIWNFI